jgi:hypothetical protein
MYFQKLLIGSLAFYFEFANSYIPHMAPCLRPIYRYCHGSLAKLDELRRIRRQLRTHCNQLFDLRAFLLDTGNLEYEIFTQVDDPVDLGTVAYFDPKPGRLLAVCNILAGLQEHGLARINAFIRQLLMGDRPYEELIGGQSRYKISQQLRIRY